MKAQLRKGFTLVEILIVVVILGILAAIVIPQFTSASQDAIRSALNSQLQTVNSQVELYRVQNAGRLPHNDPDDAIADGTPGDPSDTGWGVLISGDFLKRAPNNGYTNTASVALDAYTWDPATDGTAHGWAYDTNDGQVYANGYSDEDDALVVDDDAPASYDPLGGGGGGGGGGGP
jgi:general secretion pathway protein G